MNLDISAEPFVQNYLATIPAGKPGWSPVPQVAPEGFIKVNDSRSSAIPTNNRTALLQSELGKRIVRAALDRGVDPKDALTTAWQETLFGKQTRQMQPDGRIISANSTRAYLNPLQYNAFEKGTPGDWYSGKQAHYDEINAQLRSDPEIQKIFKERLSTKGEDDPEYQFLTARLGRQTAEALQRENIKGGLNYFAEMQDRFGKSKGIERYNGAGAEARKHRKVFEALKKVLSTNPDINSLIEEAK